MRPPSPATFRDAAPLRTALAAVLGDGAVDDELLGEAGPLGRPLAVDGLTIGNRFAVHPMEGWDGEPDGRPSAATRRRWRRFGESGAKLVWGGEAFAVSADGRANPNQLHLNDEVDPRPGLEALLDELRSGHRAACGTTDGLVVGLQLTHSGRYARPSDAGAAPRVMFRHPVLDARVGLEDDAAVLADAELERIAERFVRAAAAAREVGFDFVDVKACHGYLLHESLAARRRPGRFGGDLAGRSALLTGIVRAVRDACAGLRVGVRLSATDVFPHGRGPDGVGAPLGLEEHRPYDAGFGVDPDDPLRPDLDEPLRVIGLLRDLGVRMVNVTAGSPYTSPHLQRPAVFPPSDGYASPADPLAFVARHLDVTRRVKAAFPDLVVVGTGYSYLQEWIPHVAQHEVGRGHVDVVGLGRSMLSYPELCRDVLAGRALDAKRICRTFSDCTTGPRHGLPSGCYPLDPEYRARPEAAEIRKLRRRNG